MGLLSYAVDSMLKQLFNGRFTPRTSPHGGSATGTCSAINRTTLKLFCLYRHISRYEGASSFDTSF